jgi:hypothetical protein
MSHADLPRTSGTPYQSGTTEALAVVAVTRDNGITPAVELRFGNVFSETVIPLDLAAARELREQLAHALLVLELDRP